ncbi:MAG: TraR/DksA family transcriptional regulator [Verrucomicrobiota bacterium]|jgi:RNA polymerase-binding transcription factor DksA
MSTAADILGSNRKSKVPAKWAAHFRRLIGERDRLLAREFSSPAPSAVKMDDLGEAATEETQRILAFAAAGTTQETVFEVLEAIRRIECGTYGICEVTGEPIEEGRLKAIPWARFSLRGQQEMEAGGFGRRLAIPALQSSFEAQLTSEPEVENPEQEQAA